MARSHFKTNVGYIPFFVGYIQISKKHVGYIQIQKKNSSAIYHFGRLYTTLSRLWLNIETMSAIYHCKSAIYHSENLGRLYTIIGRPFAANFVSTRCLFSGLFTCCELSFYTRCLFWGLFTCWCELCFYTISILRFAYMFWTFFLYTISILRIIYMLWTLFLREVYFKVCLHVVNFLSIHDVYFEVRLHAANFVPTWYLFWTFWWFIRHFQPK